MEEVQRFHFEGAAEIIAHRGFSARAPENTIAAIQAAIEARADAVEFDVRVAKDGVPVLFHDAKLDRTTDGRGPVENQTLAALRELDAGAWFAPGFAGEPIPTLEDALRAIDGRLGRVYVEIKGYRNDEDLVRVVELALETGMEDRVVFIAMDWTALDRMRAHREQLRVGYIVKKASSVSEAIDRATGDPSAILDFKAALLLEDPALAGLARCEGTELAAWTVDETADAARLLDLGVPHITTNRVDTLVAWKASL